MTRPTGAEGAEVPIKGPEIRTHGIEMKQNPIVNIYLHPPPNLFRQIILAIFLASLEIILEGSFHHGVRSKTEENLIVR